MSRPFQQNSRTQRVLFQPQTEQAFQRGANAMVDAVRPTLGPLPGIVAVERNPSNNPPELIDNGGVIARRIIQLDDRNANVGAMFVRQVLWDLNERMGDGTATAAVLFQSIYNHALRYIVSGGNPMLMRKHLEIGLRIILERLDAQKMLIEDSNQLAQIARSTCTDPEMAELLSEIMEIVGPYGLVDIRSGQSREMGREYVEGSYWESGVLSQKMLTGWPDLKVELPEVAILITDLAIEKPQEPLLALNTAVKAGYKNLMIIATKVPDKAVGLLQNADKNVHKLQLVGVKTPGAGIDKTIAAMQDMAILTGGRPYFKDAGETLKNVKAEDFGHAHKAWATKTHFGFLRGQGDPIKLRSHVARLKRAYHSTNDAEQSKLFLDRIGRLLGGSATFYVGGATKSEVETRKELAKCSIKVLRGALEDGIVVGGGVVWLSCQPELQEKISQSDTDEERVSYQILYRAMEAPLRAMLTNARLDPGAILARIRSAGPGFGYDIVRGEIVCMQEEGVQDVASVQKSALISAVSSAALALTIDVLVHHKE